MSQITPCLWFDGTAEQAAALYTSLFPDSRIDRVERAPADNPSTPKGAVLTVEFTLNGRPFIGLNGGPSFRSPRRSRSRSTATDQAEVDQYWDSLIADGGVPSQCGWLRDRFGRLVASRPAPAARVPLGTGPRGRRAGHGSDAQDDQAGRREAPRGVRGRPRLGPAEGVDPALLVVEVLELGGRADFVRPELDQIARGR